jgi:hypothetical protein
MTISTRDQAFATFDQQGEDHVRLNVQTFDFATASSGSKMLNRYAKEWLAQRDKESRLRNEASSDESLRVARSAKNAAWAAAIIAAIAAVIAIASAVIAYLALSSARPS